MASSITELMSRTRVLSDSLITSACSVSASGAAALRLLSSSCEVARAACRSGGARLGAVGLVDGWHQRAGRCPQRNQTPLGQKADVVDQHPVPRVGHQQHERIVACDQGQHRFALGHRAGDEGQGRRFGRDVARVHGVFAQPRGNHAAQLVLRERAAVHQDLPDGPLHALAALALLRLQAILQRGNRQQARMRHGLTQVPRLAHGGVGRGKLLPQRVRTLRARTVGGCCGRVLGRVQRWRRRSWGGRIHRLNS